MFVRVYYTHLFQNFECLVFCSNLFEILVAHSRDTEPQNKQVMELSLDILNKLAEDKFIQPANK